MVVANLYQVSRWLINCRQSKMWKLGLPLEMCYLYLLLSEGLLRLVLKLLVHLLVAGALCMKRLSSVFRQATFMFQAIAITDDASHGPYWHAYRKLMHMQTWVCTHCRDGDHNALNRPKALLAPRNFRQGQCWAQGSHKQICSVLGLVFSSGIARYMVPHGILHC